MRSQLSTVKDARSRGYGTEWNCVKLVFPLGIHCVKIRRMTFIDTPPDPFASVQTLLLIIGNARSGSTLVGSVIDAHPQAVIANETTASATFWRDTSRATMLGEIQENSRRNRESGRQSEGYTYQVKKEIDSGRLLTVMGDKIWNPATLLLHGDHRLLDRLHEMLGIPIKIVHAVRNPFDVIATMHARSGAPIGNRIAWYFMHCEAVAAIRDRLPAELYLDNHHEDLVLSVEQTLERLCGFLGLPAIPEHAQAVKEMVFATPKQTRANALWQPEEVQLVLDGIARFDFLSRYATEAYSLSHP